MALILALLACKENTPPSMVGIDVTPDEPKTTQGLTAETTSEPTDVDDDSLTIRYRWYVDDTLVEDLTERTVPADRTAKGEVWKVNAFAWDGTDEGPATSDEVTILNTGPVLDDVAIDPEEPRSNEDVNASVETTDVDDDDLEVTYTWTLNGIGAHSGETLPGSLTTRGEEWTLHALIDDGEATDEGETSFTIGNALPVAEVTLQPQEPRTLDLVTALIAVTDHDGDEPSYEIHWTIDGAARDDLLNLEVIPASATARGQVVQVEVIPHDGFDEGEPVTAEVTVQNTAPTIDGALVTPDPAYEESELSCEPSSWSDDDGDLTEVPLVAWSVEGTEVSTDPTLDGQSFDKGDSVTCTYTPYDGTDFGEPMTSAAVIIRNTAPDVSNAVLTISPQDPVEADTVVYAVSGITDVDGDSWTEVPVWDVGGSTVTGETELTGSHFNKGQDIELTLYADDGDRSDGITSNTLTAANTAPILSAVVFDETLYTDTVASVSVTATDVDPADASLSYTYAWAVEGSSAGSGSTLDGDTAFSRDEEVAVTVTAVDGSGANSNSVTVSATVQNTAPTAPVVGIEPAVPTAGEALTCHILTDAEDADGDDISYSFAWDIGGTATFTAASTWTYGGDRVPDNETDNSEEWTCTVTPTDEAGDDGPTDSDTVTVGDCWTEVYSASLASKPSGATTMNGGWGGHSYTTQGGVSAMYQTSDWNYAYIPVTRGSLDFEKVEVDVWFASTNSTHRSFTFYAWGDRYSYNWVQNGLWMTNSLSSSSISGGNTYASSTSYDSFSSPLVSSGTWVTMAFVVDHDSNSAWFYVDGTEESSFTVSNSHVSGNSVVLRSGGSCCSAGGNTYWANLKVYEAETNASCTN